MGTTAAVTNETSQAKRTALPDLWIERLFQRMEDRFGDLWANRYGSFPRDRVKRTWAEDLADLTPEEMARGVDASKASKFPPTLPEFRALCRPPIDFEEAFHEAVQQMHARESGDDRWSHPAVFWAAATIGSFDMRNGSWTTLEKRWKKLFKAELDKGEWQPVPERALSLPAPAPTKEDREAAERMLRSMGGQLKNVGTKTWAQKVLDRITAGEVVPHQAEKMAREALAGADA